MNALQQAQISDDFEVRFPLPWSACHGERGNSLSWLCYEQAIRLNWYRVSALLNSQQGGVPPTQSRDLNNAMTMILVHSRYSLTLALPCSADEAPVTKY